MKKPIIIECSGFNLQMVFVSSVDKDVEDWLKKNVEIYETLSDIKNGIYCFYVNNNHVMSDVLEYIYEYNKKLGE